MGYPLGKPLTNNVRIEIHNSSYTAVDHVDEREAKIEKATVLEVGPEVTLVKSGDSILFKDYNLDTIEVDGETYHVIPEEDIKYLFNGTHS